MAKEIVRTGANGRMSKCTAHDELVYVSGITTVALEAGMREQARDVFAQIDKLLALNDTDKTRVLFANVTLSSMEDYGDFNAAWDEWVMDGFEPARSVTEGKLPLAEYRLEISLTAAQ